MNKNVDYKFEGKKLKIKRSSSTDKDVEFAFPIKQIVEFNNRILVRLESDIGAIYNENVFCVLLDGSIVWQVEAVKHMDEDSPYSNIVITDGQLFLYCWSGERMEVNPQNGKIIKKIFTK